jgi:hypothetical protein
MCVRCSGPPSISIYKLDRLLRLSKNGLDQRVPLVHPCTQPKEPHGKDSDRDDDFADIRIIFRKNSRKSAHIDSTDADPINRQVNDGSADDGTRDRHGECNESAKKNCICCNTYSLSLITPHVRSIFIVHNPIGVIRNMHRYTLLRESFACGFVNPTDESKQ